MLWNPKMDILLGVESLRARKPGKEIVLNSDCIKQEKILILCLFNCNVRLKRWDHIEFKPWQVIFAYIIFPLSLNLDHLDGGAFSSWNQDYPVIPNEYVLNSSYSSKIF